MLVLTVQSFANFPATRVKETDHRPVPGDHCNIPSFPIQAVVDSGDRATIFLSFFHDGYSNGSRMLVLLAITLCFLALV